MATILILGAGVMGSALTVPAVDNGHRVTLAATPHDGEVLAALQASRASHPRLGAPLSPEIHVRDAGELTPADAAAADLVIVGVSSPGIEWAADTVARLAPACTIGLVTKGLVDARGPVPLTYATAFPDMLRQRGVDARAFVGIGGPCIARELAERRPTAVVYASPDMGAAAAMKAMLETPYYRVSLSDDPVGVEACAALKNFFAIGVSAMLSRHTREGEPVKNPVAAAFQQAVDEMAALVPWLGGQARSAYGLAGVGDLHVTVGGGRNSRLGRLLGEGMTIEAAMNGPLAGETVEGVDVGRVLDGHVRRALRTGEFDGADLALATALIDAIETNGILGFDIASGG
ncbi:MAG: 2-dehydropantoate 2-reductase N-terminal domain-containing protein [Acuticoccus sp.]